MLSFFLPLQLASSRFLFYALSLPLPSRFLSPILLPPLFLSLRHCISPPFSIFFSLTLFIFLLLIPLPISSSSILNFFLSLSLNHHNSSSFLRSLHYLWQSSFYLSLILSYLFQFPYVLNSTLPLISISLSVTFTLSYVSRSRPFFSLPLSVSLSSLSLLYPSSSS